MIFVSEICFSLTIVISKYNMEKNYCSPYQICIGIGIIEFFFNLILLVSFNLTGLKIEGIGRSNLETSIHFFEILKKEFTLSSVGYNENTTTVEINLTAQDTKKFPLKNKAMTYWYDIYLNDTQTILGFDDDGAKKLIVYPRGE